MGMHWIGTIATAGVEGGGNVLMQFMPFVFMIAIFYVLLIRPQRRREKERRAMIDQLKRGETVLLTSGIIGEITAVKEKTFMVRIAEKTRVEVVKSSVAQVVPKGETPEDIES